jgi:hypothetical protein
MIIVNVDIGVHDTIINNKMNNIVICLLIGPLKTNGSRPTIQICEMKMQIRRWVVNVINKVCFRFSFVFSKKFIISQMDFVDILAFQCPNFQKSCQFF